MQKTGAIKLDDCGDYAELQCPKCNGSTIHQQTISVFPRTEDADKTLKTVVGLNRTEIALVDSENSGNPSGRRQGLRIEFECENCHSRDPETKIQLTIAQHKGATMLSWEFN